MTMVNDTDTAKEEDHQRASIGTGPGPSLDDDDKGADLHSNLNLLH